MLPPTVTTNTSINKDYVPSKTGDKNIARFYL